MHDNRRFHTGRDHDASHSENRHVSRSPRERETQNENHGRGGHGGHGGDIIGDILTNAPDTQILFVGSVNCLRHKPFFDIAKYMREGRAALLCPTMTDFASGRYLRQIRDAVNELSMERNAKEFVLIYGCQWVILSSDGELLKQELYDELGVHLTLCDDSHLECGDHE